VMSVFLYAILFWERLDWNLFWQFYYFHISTSVCVYIYIYIYIKEFVILYLFDKFYLAIYYLIL
ncbi:MAG: hypothetical protein N7Q72_04275, partial [Spiroplasma sp. Tabriz.8]|nr:hypothetical protein [Spiroplasma sp. Tabriz.8]